MIALDFIKSLQDAPAFLRVEPQPGGGVLIECPGCSSVHKGSVFALNQLGEELLVRCYGGCEEDHLIGTLHVAGGEAPLIGARQWLEREVSRGHELPYLRNMLGRLLPLPPEFLSPEQPKARTWSEFMALKPRPRESLCGQWFRTGALAMVSGDSGAGKSWFCLDLAISVSTGTTFMGRWSVPKARKVLLVSGEDDIDDLQERGLQLLKTKSKAEGRELEPQITFLNTHDLDLLPNGLPNLSTPEGRAKVESNLEGVSLVILDNYGTCFNGVDENDAQEFAPTQDWLFWFKTRGISVLLATQTGKNGDHRGSSKKVDGLNVSIILNHPTNWKARDGASFNLQFKKSRDARGPEVDSFCAELGEDEEGDICWLFDEAPPATRAGTIPSPKTAEILELHSQGKTAKEIIELGYTKPMVYKVLSALKKSSPKMVGVSQSTSLLSTTPKGVGSRLVDSRPAHQSPESTSLLSTSLPPVDSRPATQNPRSLSSVRLLDSKQSNGWIPGS
jgi:AAA domain